MKHLFPAAAIVALAACSPAELGRLSLATSDPPTLPANCAELLELGRDCAVTVPRAGVTAAAPTTSSPITRALRADL